MMEKSIAFPALPERRTVLISARSPLARRERMSEHMLTRVGYQGEWNIESFVGNVEAGLKNSMTVTKRLRKGV